MASSTGRQGNVDTGGRKGPEVTNHPDTAPYISENKNIDNFEHSVSAAKNMRGLKSVDPRNVRGSSNYK